MDQDFAPKDYCVVTGLHSTLYYTVLSTVSYDFAPKAF